MPFNSSPLSISTPQLACADQKSNQLASYMDFDMGRLEMCHNTFVYHRDQISASYDIFQFFVSAFSQLFLVFLFSFAFHKINGMTLKDNSHEIPWMFKLIFNIFEHPRQAIAVKAALAVLKSLQAVARLFQTTCEHRNDFSEPPSPQKQP